MKAIISAKAGKDAGFQREGQIRKHRKENHFHSEYAGIVPAQDCGYGKAKDGFILRTLITARLYVVPSRTYGSTFPACVWISSSVRKNQQSYYLSGGGGKAGGCGYHKASAALEAAFNDAQITFDEGVSGVGEMAMKDALATVAVAMGYKRFHTHNAHA